MKSDTTCLPDSQLRIALQKIEQGKKDAAALKVEQGKNNSLEIQINYKSNAIKKQADSIALYGQIIDGFKSERVAYKKELLQRENKITGLEKKVKRRGRALLIGAGAVVAYVAFEIL